MIKQTITFEDFNGNKRIEEAHFHLNEVEVVEMAYDNKSLFSKIEEISKNEDMYSTIKIIKELIYLSYGKKSEDGMYFEKFDENGKRYADKFIQTAAYSAMFMELAKNDAKCNQFINGVLPKELSEEAKKQIASIQE